MEKPTGDSGYGPRGLDFDRRVNLEFQGSGITFDTGLLTSTELGDALGLSSMAGGMC